MMKARYQQIARHLDQQRDALRDALRLPEEHALAHQHGVARETIRKALKILENQGGVVRRQRRGTFLQPRWPPAATHLRGKTIGLIPPWWANSLSHWCTATVFDGISRWADEHACTISVLHTDHTATQIEAQWLERIRSRDLAGLIWLHPQSQQMVLAQKLNRLLPLVVVGRETPRQRLHRVLPDYDQGAEMIDERLVACGHEHYAVVGTDILGGYSQKWIQAFSRAYQVRGAQFNVGRQFIDVKPFDRSRIGAILMSNYTDAHPVHAFVFTHSSFLTCLVSDQAFRRSIGRTNSLVCVNYGTYPVESFCSGWRIDHVACDWPQIGKHAASTLGRLISGDVVPLSQVLPVHYETGDTIVAHPALTPSGPALSSSDLTPSRLRATRA